VREKRIESRRAGTDAAVVTAVLARNAQRALDAGCGEGWLARSLNERGIEVVGFDGSAPLIERATAAGGGRFERSTYDEFIADPTRFGADFDVIIFNFSLFTEDITPVLRAAAQTLRRGGALIIQTIHPFNDAASDAYRDGWREETFASMGSDFKTPMPWYFRTMETWLTSVTAAGFTLAGVREPYNETTGKPLSLLIEGVI
jgi:2-polyprenyl-3-methyl-5-hydroxy-6-metoxy-1,4-benzoquinol methylase